MCKGERKMNKISISQTAIDGLLKRSKSLNPEKKADIFLDSNGPINVPKSSIPDNPLMYEDCFVKTEKPAK